MKIKCGNCSDVIESMYNHDFKWCKCHSIFIDGGKKYPRWGFNPGVKVYEVIDGEDFVIIPGGNGQENKR